MAGENSRAGLPVRLTDSLRYRMFAPIGQGAMGIVYRARDTLQDHDVALKTLRWHTPDEVYQLKKEFRVLSQLSHPNLVQLYDLVVLDDQCFFTMELIDGVDLVRHIRRSDGSPTGGEAAVRVDYERLRDAVYQLAVGLHALHSYGKIHRDVKPANILVETTGRVVLLDFGLAGGLVSDVSRNSRVGTLVGTLAYMAPEQAAGKEISLAADWYSVGIVLYEVLTGKLPFEGPALVSAFARTCTTPTPPRALVPETPVDLDTLTMELLRTAPEGRPSGQEVLARLQPGRGERPLERVAQSAPLDDVKFVGRARELTELRDAFDAMRRDGLVTVCVSGASGIGKSSLVERFLSMLAQFPDTVILKARCHPQESIPFKAVDGAIDDLARFLSHQSDAKVEAVLPRDIAALARIFPVLGRVQAIAAVFAREQGGKDLQEIRRRAFASLRDLLARVADRRPLILWIDDFQWGDLDSVALLRTLRTPPDAPRLLVLLSFRRDDQRTVSISRLFDDGDVVTDRPEPPRQIEIAPLPEPEACELARQIIVEEGAAANEAEIMAIARESAGSPFFTCELARHLAVQRAATPDADADISLGVSGLVAQRVAALADLDRRLLEIVSVAGEPVREELIYKVGEHKEDVGRVLARLRADRLLRPAVLDDQPAVDTYHDRVRETVVQRLSTESYRVLHCELAAALRSLPNPDPQRLVEHYFQANDLARAGEQAFASAERAMEALAFDQALRLYRRALELRTRACPPWVLRAKLGATLANMGRAGEAAPLFVAAAQELAGSEEHNPEVSRLKRQAAEHYMRCGLHDEGLAVLRQVLAHAGLRYSSSTNRVIFSLIVNRARLWLRHALPLPKIAARRTARDEERLEVCWSAGLGLGVSDTLRAADFQVRHALMAQRAGNAAHQARAFATEALLMVWEGGARKRRRAARLRVESERLARASRDPNIEAYSLVLRAVGTFFERRLREAVSLADRAEALCRDKCVGVAWELANVQTIGMTARVFLGDLVDLRRRVETTLREGRERGDQYSLLMCRLGYCSMAWLAADEPDEAGRQAQGALAQPFPATFTWPIYLGALAQTQIDLYRGHGSAGWRRMQEAWAALNAGSMLRLQPVRIEMRELRARCALSVASEPTCDADERRRMLRFAARAARSIAAEDVHWAAPFADALRGGVAATTGDTHTARTLLASAAVGFDHLEMGLHAAAARFQLAQLLVAPEAAQLRAEQCTWMLDHGVRNPQRMAALLSPGIAVA